MQSYKQLQKDALIQAQDQYHSNCILCGLMATAESLVCSIYNDLKEKYPLPIKYDAYDLAGNKYNNDTNLLYKKLVMSYEQFESSYTDYVEQHAGYVYPINLPVQDILNDLNKWRKILPQEYHSIYPIYDALINFFKKGKFTQLREPVSYSGQKKADPYALASMVGNIKNYISSGEQNVKEQFERKGKYEFSAKLGQQNDEELKNKIEKDKKLIHGSYGTGCDFK